MKGPDERLDAVRRGMQRVSQIYHRLLLVVVGGTAVDGGQLAENLGARRVALGEKLAEGLVEVPPRSRPLHVAGLLDDLLEQGEGDEPVLLDNIEVLFERSLRVDPLTLLRGVARRRLVIAVWNGDVEAGNLIYAYPGHPEHRSYPASDVELVKFS